MSSEQPATIPAIVEAVAGVSPDRLAFASARTTLTYAQWDALANQVARGLLERGLRPGERLALLLPNSAEWLIVALAGWKVGALVVPLSTWATVNEWSYQLRHSDAAFLVFAERFRNHCYFDEFQRLCPEAHFAHGGASHLSCAAFPALRNAALVCQEHRQQSGDLDLDALIGFGNENTDALATLPGGTPEDEAVILYTSGSTGKPKGVVHVHGALTRHGRNIAHAMRLQGTDHVFSHFPFFFSAGLCNALMSSLAAGATFVSQSAFEPGEALDLIERYRCSARMMSPEAIRGIIGHPEFAPSRVATMTKGLRPIGFQFPQLGLPQETGVSVYGMTETCTSFTCTDADDPPEIRLQTHGRPFPGNDLRIVDPVTGTIAPNGTEGEICVRGYSVLRRYHKHSEHSAFDADGYLRTGDRGVIDSSGRLRYLGRTKSMIKSGGFSVSAEEIEEVLREYLPVDQACVLGVADSERGESIVALVTLNPSPGTIPATVESIVDGIRRHCASRLSSYKVPHRIEIADRARFPLTASGKPNRAALRAQLSGHPGESNV